MIDIVDRLRATADFGIPDYTNSKLLREASDEITRLREENARLREAVKAAYYEGWTDNSSREYALQEINNDWETSEACATIREGQDNE